jgi:hypothetical protein
MAWRKRPVYKRAKHEDRLESGSLLERASISTYDVTTRKIQA